MRDPSSSSSATGGNPSRAVCWIQGAYFLLTGLWPIVHIDSFQVVTGPKTDLWLVKTVAALVVAVGVVLLSAAWRGAVTCEILLLGVLTAMALATIDVVYAAILDRIPDIYLLDAAAEMLIVAAWLGTYFRLRRGAP